MTRLKLRVAGALVVKTGAGAALSAADSRLTAGAVARERSWLWGGGENCPCRTQQPPGTSTRCPVAARCSRDAEAFGQRTHERSIAGRPDRDGAPIAAIFKAAQSADRRMGSELAL